MYTFDENVISDLHKDAYGFRPDSGFWATFAAFNPDQKQALWDSMLADLDRAIEDEEEGYKMAAEEFEARIDSLIHDCSNRKAIVGWFLRAENFENEIESFEFVNGLPFGYLKKMGYV